MAVPLSIYVISYFRITQWTLRSSLLQPPVNGEAFTTIYYSLHHAVGDHLCMLSPKANLLDPRLSLCAHLYLHPPSLASSSSFPPSPCAAFILKGE